MQGSTESANNQLISFPENKTLFHKSCIVVYNKQKLSRKQKLKENDNGDKTGSCNVDLEDEKECKNTKKRAKSSEILWTCVFFLSEKSS